MEGVMLTALILIVVVILIVASVRIAMEYERAIVFRFGRFNRVTGPGLFLLIPFIETREEVSLRIDTVEVKQQEMITKDSISLVVSAVVWFRVNNPKMAIIEVEDYYDAIDHFSLTSLRNVVGASTLDEILSERDLVAGRARIMLDEVTEKWGVESQRVELKQIELPDTMKRAMAREAEAIREKRARIIKAEAEQQASALLTRANEELSRSPGAIELRRLQMIGEVGAEHNSTIVVAIPQGWFEATK